MTDKKVDSTPLDPELVKDIQGNSAIYDASQRQADDCKWNIARRVNEDWEEHKTLVDENGELFFADKDVYYAECSRVANIGLKHPRFAASGQTLRRWCEVEATYRRFEHADKFLDALSFEHLRMAKSLAFNGKVKNPVLALAEAVKNKWTAKEMDYHYDPPTIIHPYDAMKERLAVMSNYKSWEFLKSVENKKACIYHAEEIRKIVEAEILAEGKAV